LAGVADVARVVCGEAWVALWYGVLKRQDEGLKRVVAETLVRTRALCPRLGRGSLSLGGTQSKLFGAPPSPLRDSNGGAKEKPE